jgi:predicted RNase H-like nuclease (RuvC/YqgF family)
MKTNTTRKLIAAALATTLTSFAAIGFAQNSNAPSQEMREQHMAQRADRQGMSPAEQQAKMQQRHAERQAALKATLNITTEQEPAWNAFVSRTAPKARMERRADREDWAKLTTPERLDKMQARQAERAATMTRRMDATRSLYSALSPEQQKQFDAQAMTHFQRAGMHGKHHDRGHGAMKPRS